VRQAKPTKTPAPKRPRKPCAVANAQATIQGNSVSWSSPQPPLTFSNSANKQVFVAHCPDEDETIVGTDTACRVVAAKDGMKLLGPDGSEVFFFGLDGSMRAMGRRVYLDTSESALDPLLED
jgi:hypothetical protein